MNLKSMLPALLLHHGDICFKVIIPDTAFGRPQPSNAG